MTRYQRAKRHATWKGATLALLLITAYFFALSFAGSLTGQ